MSTPQQPPAGWYPDPATPGALRYWDGLRWTEHTSVPSPAGTGTPAEAAAPAYAAAPAAAPAYAAAPARTSPGVDTNTPWIWLIVLLPALSVLAVALMPWRRMFDMMPYANPNDTGAMMWMQFDVFLSPWWWSLMLLGWAIYGFSVWFAYLDRQELLKRGIDRPFPWPWMFLSIVYPIGRAVVVIRRTGKGWGPIWGLIGVQVLSFVIATVVSVQIMGATFEFIREISRYSGYSG